MFVSQGHGVKHCLARRAGGDLSSVSSSSFSSSATNTDKVQTPSAQSTLFPGAFRLGTYTYKHKEAWVNTDTRCKKMHIIVVNAQQNADLEGTKETSTTKSLCLLLRRSSRQQMLKNPLITHVHSHTQWWQSALFALKVTKLWCSKRSKFLQFGKHICSIIWLTMFFITSSNISSTFFEKNIVGFLLKAHSCDIYWINSMWRRWARLKLDKIRLSHNMTCNCTFSPIEGT